MSHLNLSPTSLRRLRRAAPARRQRGFSLLEALVSIVVLSFGLLGVAGLQASALKYSRDARNQSVAINLAREMAEMIRSNARISGTAASLYLVDVQDVSSADAPTNTIGPFATADDLAAAQVADWKNRVGQALPGAYAAVCKDDRPYDTTGDHIGAPHWGCTGTGDIIVIKIGWERDGTEGVVQNATGKRKDRDGNLTDEDMRPYVVLPVTPAGQQ